ncbi:hypothetical protein F0562_006420 [Nyssa sinensis]|uniref:non-specific serine/threonine protein kinase n=1 Tax=Nyssa sinensis TaxID=561372 RepID=A0A5J5ALJ9_9ASTE|nr:hypothetical protein F0562_006420 [Nyssa sinensis]
MASSPVTAPSPNSSPPAPPTNSSSASPPPPSNSSPPPSSPPPSSPPPASSSSPPPASPPPKTSPSSPPPAENPPQSPPQNASPASPPPSTTIPLPLPSPSPPPSPPPSGGASPLPPSTNIPSLPSPVFSPPPPVAAFSSPPAPSSSTTASPPPPHAAAEKSPPTSSTSSNSSSSTASDSTLANTAIVAGVAVTGILFLAIVIICVTCLSRRKKRDPYNTDPRTPGGGEYGYPSQMWPKTNGRQSVDHIVKLPPPPGGGGSGGGGWGAPNMSSDYSSYAGANHGPMQTPSPGLGFNQSTFSYEELAAATGGFSDANVLGQGGFGFVHKGVLPNGKEVAVKSLKLGSGQGEREFQAEVEIISRVHHRHLVSLVGYCIADGQRMLVYEFVPNKTMEFHLHGHPRIIHRDIKAANILLDNNYEAMVADFGLAKPSSDNFTHVSTRVMGTFGYLAPEYASSGKLSDKSDVFSYGVMLLELITGRRPVDPSGKIMEDSLVDWARPLLQRALEDGNYEELVDPRLENNYISHEMARMIGCAAAGIRHSARRRPRMSQIVRALEGESSLEDLNESTVKTGQQSSVINPNGGYDTGAYNADMMKFRKMVLSSQEFNSSEYGATSEYGLNPSTSSSDSREMPHSGIQRQKL